MRSPERRFMSNVRLHLKADDGIVLQSEPSTANSEVLHSDNLVGIRGVGIVRLDKVRALVLCAYQTFHGSK